jgi:S1-C subfamily serine protease/pSer/pThr/pTyr-binding forkhead associated (FHA) protein
VKIQIKVLGGARIGVTGVFSRPKITLGRHPSSDLQFDPQQDLDVSGTHTALVQVGDRWFVRDLGSTNGTYVNGHRITSDTRLDDTDQIRFGENGPHMEIRLVGDSTPDSPPPPLASAEARAAPRVTASSARPDERKQAPAKRSGSTTQRIRVEVGRQTRRLRAMTVVLLLALIAVVGWFVIDNRRQEAGRARQVEAMQRRIDSILAASEEAMAMLQGQVEGLASALRQSQSQVQRLQRDLTVAQASGDDAEVESLRLQLANATQVFRNQQLAAQVDYRAINSANENAVAMIWADFGGGDISSGTAFTVTADGKMITNRHVVAGEDGSKRPSQIAIQFTNSDQVWRGRLLGVLADVDLAAVQVLGIAGNVPTVQGLEVDPRTNAVGEPVAIIGFPLGQDLPMRSSGERTVVRATFSAGTISKVLPDLVQVDGYGAPGASGSPVFNRDGRVISVLWGAQEGSNGRIVFTVPASFIQELLLQLN